MEQLNHKFFKKLISKRLSPLGFNLKSSTWIKQLNDAVIGVNLQRSRYSSMCFLNYFVWYPEISDRDYTGYIKGCFHLSSRGCDDLNRQREEYLILDNRLVEMDQFEQRFEDIFLFSEMIEKLIEYSSLNAINHFYRNDYEVETGFAASYELIEYLKSREQST